MDLRWSWAGLATSLIVLLSACGDDEALGGQQDASVATGGTAGAAGMTVDAGKDVTSDAGGGGSDAAVDVAMESAPPDAAPDAIADASTEGDAPDPLAPDFSLVDENPNSTTYQQKVSPRDYLGKVSAYYFGQAT